jgi:alanyl-tRNA synthetase
VGVTERLYYSDSYLKTFTATVLETSGERVYLDRTAFYPASGGQPFDTGTLGGVRVLDVADEGDRIAHVLEQPIATGPIAGEIDWARRFDHMQQHTGQHLLSAVFEALAGLATISFHLGRDVSTIDLDAPSVAAETIERIERVANEEVARNHEVTVAIEDAASVEGLRKVSERQGAIRVVTITGLDRSACGGTHVRRTGEIGCILLRKTEKIRSATRVEFVCGLRAVAMVRADRLVFKEQTETFQERIGGIEKDRRKLAAELADYRGRDLYQRTVPSADGIRRSVTRQTEISDAVRAEAQAFLSGGGAIYVALAGESILIAISEGAGPHAGQLLKRFADRGGGSATLAQGSIANPVPLLQELGIPAA